MAHKQLFASMFIYVKYIYVYAELTVPIKFLDCVAGKQHIAYVWQCTKEYAINAGTEPTTITNIDNESNDN